MAVRLIGYLKEQTMPQDQVPEEERNETLEQLEGWIETPMAILAFVWLMLLVVELTRGLTPTLQTLTTAVWILFVLEFSIKLALAPRKPLFIRRNWLVVVSLLVPALRIFRITRFVRFLNMTKGARGLRLVKVVGSLNRGINTLRTTFGHFGMGYVVIMSGVVTLVGAAGMYAFENSTQGGEGLEGYGDALWWTAMIMTTLGSQYWPVTAEGRILGFLLSLYAFGVFGYVTAALASFFIGRSEARESAGKVDAKTIEALRREMRLLREEMREVISRCRKP